MSTGFTRHSVADYKIENIELWNLSQPITEAQVLVEDGKLKYFGPKREDISQKNIHTVDGRKAVLLPAGVDVQTHLRVPGQSHKETPQTGLTAALKGGYSAVLTMPNTLPTIDNTEVLAQARELTRPFEDELGVKVFWSAAITHKLNSDQLTDFRSLIKADVRAFTNDGLGVLSDHVMDQAFSALENETVPLLQHAEFLGHGGALAPGPIQQKVGAKPYPEEPEWRMVERDLKILERYPKARYHVLHVTGSKSIELIRAAKRRGLLVTAEVTPHHLFFNTETILEDNTAFKMNPPIRTKWDQISLWRALQDGTLDFVSTDHAPHEHLMKVGSFNDVAFGTLGLETTISVLVDGWQKGFLSPRRFVEVWAKRPAQFLNLPKGYGEFQLDAPFHAVWVDVRSPRRVYTVQHVSSLSKNSCFLGSELPGQILGAFHQTQSFIFG